MPFYDIMLLYNSYAEYVDKENEQHAAEQAKYEEQYEEQKSAMNMNNFKVPDMNSITKGMINGSQFKMPNF